MDAIKAAEIVDKIIADLTDRSGLTGEWDAIDEETREEIREAWIEILLTE